MSGDPREYSDSTGEWFAEQYAEAECSIKELCDMHSDILPGPLWIRRWRDQYPVFDLLMVEAEKVRAEMLVDGTLTIAGDPKLSAAQASNGIKVRHWLAERLDRKRYGRESTVKQEISGHVTHEHVAVLTDDQLMAIAAGEDPIEGEILAGKNNDPARIAPPHPPACDATPHPQFLPDDEQC